VFCNWPHRLSVTSPLQQANIDALCPKPDAGVPTNTQGNSRDEFSILSGSLEARREKKAAVTSFARQRDDRQAAY
jgi:hypothetical protein